LENLSQRRANDHVASRRVRVDDVDDVDDDGGLSRAAARAMDARGWSAAPAARAADSASTGHAWTALLPAAAGGALETTSARAEVGGRGVDPHRRAVAAVAARGDHHHRKDGPIVHYTRDSASEDAESGEDPDDDLDI